MTELSLADQAVLHLVRRVQSDPNFAWHMVGTEGLSLCFQAIAARTGEGVDAVRERIESNAASLRESPEVVELRNRVEELEQQAADCFCFDGGEEDADDFEPDQFVADEGFELREQLDRLLLAAECGQALRPEHLRAVLEGARADIVLCSSGGHS